MIQYEQHKNKITPLFCEKYIPSLLYVNFVINVLQLT